MNILQRMRWERRLAALFFLVLLLLALLAHLAAADPGRQPASPREAMSHEI